MAVKKTKDAKNRFTEQRRFIRHPMCFPLAYRVITETKGSRIIEGHSKTINISRGGLLFAAKKPVALGTPISIKMPFQDKLFNVKAHVVHCDAAPEGNVYMIGVCFQRVNDAFKVRLIEQMYLISEYRDLQSVCMGREISMQEASVEWIKHYSERFRRMYW